MGANGRGSKWSQGTSKWLSPPPRCALEYCFGHFTCHGQPLTKHLVKGIFHIFSFMSCRNGHRTSVPVSATRPWLSSCGHTESTDTFCACHFERQGCKLCKWVSLSAMPDTLLKQVNIQSLKTNFSTDKFVRCSCPVFQKAKFQDFLIFYRCKKQASLMLIPLCTAAASCMI